VSLAFGAQPDSLAAAIVRSGIDTSAQQPKVRQRAIAFRTRIARQHFREARHARGEGRNSTALHEFGAAAKFGIGTYLEDDALYELARAQAAVGAWGDASVTARRLLATYPRSVFANSIMNALAANTATNARN
jgi:hypothetical protein